MVRAKYGGCVGREEEKKNRVMRVRVVSGSGVWVLQSLGREKMKNRERKKWRSATQKNGKQKTKKREKSKEIEERRENRGLR